MRKIDLFVSKATLLFMGGLFLLSGCGDNKKTASSKFICESVCYDDSVAEPAKVYAYIDASGSMKGYFSLQSDGRFITALSDVNPDRINWMDYNFTQLDGVPTNSLLTNKYKIPLKVNTCQIRTNGIDICVYIRLFPDIVILYNKFVMLLFIIN